MCESPALTAVYVPATTVVWLLVFSPQQWIAPLLRKPQVWPLPALTAVNVPVCASVRPLPLLPQQWIAPALRNPQLWLSPALIARKEPAAAWPDRCGCLSSGDRARAADGTGHIASGDGSECA